METIYFFSSGHGDVPIAAELSAQPFMVHPMERHPFLRLGDFLQGVRNFVWSQNGDRLAHLLQVDPRDIDTMFIRYEKYGSLYHVISVEAQAGPKSLKLVVNAAHSQDAQATLRHECELMARLGPKYQPPCIPRIFFVEQVDVASAGGSDIFCMALADWFDGYHEWHFDGDGEQAEGAVIWDTHRGFRLASQAEIGAIIRRATQILTFYCDARTGRRIHPWHHGAGDFIVRSTGAAMDVRLISVRGYDSFFSQNNPAASPQEAMVAFLMETSLKMRLDKREGMGPTVWAGPFVLPFLLKGFVAGLRDKERCQELDGLSADGVMRSLKDCSENAIRHILSLRIGAFRSTDPQDHPTLIKNLSAHCRQLHQAIRHFAMPGHGEHVSRA